MRGRQVAHAYPELQLRLDDDGIDERMPRLPAHDALQGAGGVAAEPQLALGIFDERGPRGDGQQEGVRLPQRLAARILLQGA
eukprot:5367029-Pyramimonas_sp.AAC.1